MLTSPHILFDNQVDALLASLPAARDACVEGVHAARVATRRIREALPLFRRQSPDDVDRITRVIKRTGRRLGRVRELDVMEADLARRALRMPSALHAIGAARRALDRRRTTARRRLVKMLDGLGLDRRQMRLAHAEGGWRIFRRRAGDDWEPVLRRRIGDRAGRLREAVDHASGVYFPNRLHQVRVAAKKLRYSVELAQQSGLWTPSHIQRDLRRSQEALGRLHDAQILLDTTDDLVLDAGVDSTQVRLLKDDLEGEIVEGHGEYLASRDRLLTGCDVCDEFGAGRAERARHRVVGWPLLAASALVVPAGLLMLGSRARQSVRSAYAGGLRGEPQFAEPRTRHITSHAHARVVRDVS